MTRIDRYILSQLIGAFGLFAMILVSIYWLNRAVSIFGRLIADGQGAGIFLQIIALSLPYVVSLVLPVAVLAAALWVTNSLTAESERVVMEAAGAGGWRLTRAYLVFGTLVAVLLALLVHWLVPASRAALSAKGDEIARDVVARLVVPGEFLHPAPGVTLFIGSASPSGDIESLFLHESTAEGTRSYTADRGRLISDEVSPVLLMFDGLVQTLDRTNGSLAVVGFRDLAYELAPLVSDRSGRLVPLREVNSWRLLRAGAALRGATDATAIEMRTEVHRRASQTLAPVIFSLLGLAALMIGRFSRFGAWRQIVLAVVAAVVLSSLGSRAEDIVDDAPGLWPLLYAQTTLGLGIIALMLLAADRPQLFRWRRPRGSAP